MQRIDLKNLQGYIQEKGFVVEKYCYKCRKISYRTQVEAKGIAAEICKKGKGHSYTYECPKGCGYHLTSMKPTSMKCPKIKKKNNPQYLRDFCYLVIF